MALQACLSRPKIYSDSESARFCPLGFGLLDALRGCYKHSRGFLILVFLGIGAAGFKPATSPAQLLEERSNGACSIHLNFAPKRIPVVT